MANFWKELKKPVIGLAPMDGVTDHPMRQIQAGIARPGVMFTEFISVEFLSAKPAKLAKRMFFKDNERPIVAQIFGHTPSAFGGIVEKISAAGFDGVEINMGCPSRSVTKNGAGGALIGNFKLASQIIDSVLDALEKTGGGIPLSVKTRIGPDAEASGRWFEFLSKYPLAAVTVHGRPLGQGLAGPVDWNGIAAAAAALKPKGIFCLGNGGLTSLEEAEKKCLESGLDGALIGKAAVGNPWVFKRGCRPGVGEILDTLAAHGELAQEFYGAGYFPSVFKHFCGYAKGFDGCKHLRTELLKTRSAEETRKVVADFYSRFQACAAASPAA